MSAWDHLDPKDFVQIKRHQTLSDDDLKVLLRLYAPIVGVDALFLYLYLQYMLLEEEQVILLSQLLNQTNYSIERFYDARRYLEGIGLISVYQDKKDNHFSRYQLERPLSVREFLTDSVLIALLTEKIGASSVKSMIDNLEKEDEDHHWVNMTESFNHVYSLHYSQDAQAMADQAEQIDSDSDQKRPEYGKRAIEKASQTFNFEFLKESLNSHFVQQKSLTEPIKQLIATYHLMYGMNEFEVQKLILQAADIQTGYINEKSLSREFLDYIDTKFKKSAKQAEPKQDSDLEKLKEKAKKAGLNADEWQLIAIATELSPIDFITDIKRQRGGHVTNNEKWTIKNLVSQSTLSNATINILIHYILEIVKQPSMNQNYAENIANDWAQTGVKDPVDAFEHVKQVYQKGEKKHQKRLKRQNQWRSRPKRQEQLPEWMESSKDKNKVDDDNPSDSDKDDSEEDLNALRKMRDQWSNWSKGGEMDG